MDKEAQIKKMTSEALGSLDGMVRASAKPWLFAKISSRLNQTKSGVWERAGRFISRPEIAFTGLCLVIILNAMIMITRQSSSEITVNTEQQLAADDYSASVAILFDTENTAP